MPTKDNVDVESSFRDLIKYLSEETSTAKGTNACLIKGQSLILRINDGPRIISIIPCSVMYYVDTVRVSTPFETSVLARDLNGSHYTRVERSKIECTRCIGKSTFLTNTISQNCEAKMRSFLMLYMRGS